jgi:hypothetical protein
MFGDIDARREDLVTGEPSAPENEPENEPENASWSDAGDLGHGGVDDVASAEIPTPPVTGDEAVDEAMMRLAESQAGSFAERIEAGEHAHRSLQGRLGGLGGA